MKQKQESTATLAQQEQKLDGLPREILILILLECQVSDLLQLERVSMSYSCAYARSDERLDLYKASRRGTNKACLGDQASTLGPPMRSQHSLWC